MTSFSIRIPFVGEAPAVFKTVSDVFSYFDFSGEKLTQTSDDTASFSMPITFGVFRLLLDGTIQIADRDLENHVSLLTLTSRDRGGKGKLDSQIRITLDWAEQAQAILCNCEVSSKGMISRVNLPIEDVVRPQIENLISKAIKECEANYVAPEFIDEALIRSEDQEVEVLIPIHELDKDEETLGQPLWVVLLKLPSMIISYPIQLIRRIFFPS